MEQITHYDFRKKMTCAKSIIIVKKDVKFGHFNLCGEIEEYLKRYKQYIKENGHSIAAICTSYYDSKMAVEHLTVVSSDEAIIRFSDNSYLKYFNSQFFAYENILAMVNYEFNTDTFRAMIFEII